MSRYLQVDCLRSGIRDSSGNSLASGKVYVYYAGTSTAASLYQDAEGGVAHTNPLILDARGASAAWGIGAYKFIIKDSNDVTQYTWDNLFYSKPEDSSIYCGTSTGSSNVFAASPSPAITSYVDGDLFTFIANHATSGAATLNVSGLGAKSFVKVDGTTALGVGDITSGQIVDARYVGSSDHFRLVSQSGVLGVSSGGTGGATAAAARASLGVLSMGIQAAGAVAITGGTAELTSLVAGTVQGQTGANLVINARTGRNIAFTEEGTLKASIPSGTTSGSCIFAVDVNNNYVLGQSSFAFQNIYTYGVTYKNPFNFNNAGFSYTTRTSLNPAAATASNVADYVLTLVEKLSLSAGVSFTP